MVIVPDSGPRRVLVPRISRVSSRLGFVQTGNLNRWIRISSKDRVLGASGRVIQTLARRPARPKS